MDYESKKGSRSTRHFFLDLRGCRGHFKHAGAHQQWGWIGPIAETIVAALIYQYFLLKDENNG